MLIPIARMLAVLSVVLAAACAEFAFLLRGEHVDFELNGRIAVRYREEASTGTIAWRHRADSDEVLLSTPLGQGIARIVRAGETVTLTTADAQEHRAADAESLTESVLGFRLPLAGLADWVRGRAAAGPAEVRTDARGRLSRLDQSGWTIEYLEYGENQLPSRLKLGYPGIEIRLAVGEWKSGTVP